MVLKIRWHIESGANGLKQSCLCSLTTIHVFLNCIDTQELHRYIQSFQRLKHEQKHCMATGIINPIRQDILWNGSPFSPKILNILIFPVHRTLEIMRREIQDVPYSDQSIYSNLTDLPIIRQHIYTAT